MTPQTICECCLKNKGFELPELNEILMLNYRGFRKIEGLAAYTQVRSIFLDCNGIHKIENLDSMPLLNSLYLQSNCIRRIENLDKLEHLQYLNLAQNDIAEVENLGSLKSLETLNLSANKIQDMAALAGLKDRPTLRSVDVSCNYIEDGPGLLSFWDGILPDIECLYVHHNPCSRELKDARRTLVSSLPRLRWLDDRPVTAVERAGCEAWANNGKSRDAELKAKQEFWKQEREDKERSFNNTKRVQEAYAQRVRAQQELQAKRDAAREEVSATLESTGVLEEGWVEVATRQDAGAASQPASHSSSGPKSDLRAKVEARLARRQEESKQQEQSQNQRVPEAQSTAELSVRAASPVAKEGKTSEANLATASPGNVAEVDLPAATFEWSSFRDRRLGSLVAEFRYNFKKAAAALSEEFASTVSEAECRQRYGQLCRPSKQQGANKETDKSAVSQGIKQAGAAAKDSPAPDAAAVQEVSQWFVRRCAAGPTEGTQTQAVKSSKESRRVDTDEKETLDLNIDESDQPVAAPQARASEWSGLLEAPASASQRTSAAPSSASQGIFDPPPRVTLSANEGKTTVNRPPATTKGGSQEESLFELD